MSLLIQCNSIACSFDRTPTVPIIAFEIFVIISTIILLFLLLRIEKKVLLKYLVVLAGVFIFEFFTMPMWNNYHMGDWAYVYRDVSWILTLGWSSLIFGSIKVVDHYLPNSANRIRLGLYLLVLLFLVWAFESIVITIGIRSYSPEVQAVFTGLNVFNVPIVGLYYIPAFTALIIGFYKYFEFMIDGKPIVPVRGKFLRNLLITFLAVLMFEIMVEPMVVNANLPDWSYIYRDISIILTGIWVLIIWIVTSVVDYFWPHFNLVKKFIAYVIGVGILTLPYEAYLINHGYRIYGSSSVANFSGFQIPFYYIPVEIFFAIPLYLALVIGLNKYLQIILDNRYSK